MIKVLEHIEPDEIHITYTGNEVPRLSQKLKKNGSTFFWPLENRGRDTLPTLRLAREGVFSNNSVVWKLHTKKSPQLLQGNSWRRRLIQPLAGTIHAADFVFEQISSGSYDLIGASEFTAFSSHQQYLEHAELYSAWEKALGVKFEINKPYIKGTMFACNSMLLNQLSRIPFEEGDFPLEDVINFSYFFRFSLFLVNRFSVLRGSRTFSQLDSRTRPYPGITYAMEPFYSALSRSYLALDA